MNLRNFRIFLLAAVTSATVLNAQSTTKSAATIPTAKSTAKTADAPIEGFGAGVGLTNDLALRDAVRDARSRLACNSFTSLRVASKQCEPKAPDSHGADQVSCTVQLIGVCNTTQTAQTAQTNPVKPAPRSTMSPAPPTSSMTAKSTNSATAQKP